MLYVQQRAPRVGEGEGVAVNRRPWIEFSPLVFFFQLMLKSHQGPLTLDSILGKREREWQLSLSSSYSLFAGLSQQ